MLAREGLDDLGGPVGRPIVDHNNFRAPRFLLDEMQNPVERSAQARAFIVCRNNDRDAWKQSSSPQSVIAHASYVAVQFKQRLESGEQANQLEPRTEVSVGAPKSDFSRMNHGGQRAVYRKYLREPSNLSCSNTSVSVSGRHFRYWAQIPPRRCARDYRHLLNDSSCVFTPSDSLALIKRTRERPLSFWERIDEEIHD